jgi:transaldolase / glucose-6-phosphate isomerase
MSTPINSMSYQLPRELEDRIQPSLAEWQAQGNVRRLWAQDASLWTGGDEGKWLGWLSVVQEQLALCETLRQFADEIRHAQFRDVVLLGMGGSSLCPEVLSLTFGKQDGFPTLHILDSTDPAQVVATERKVDLGNSLFIVASKSGSTLEPNIFKQYFFDRVRHVVGVQEVGKRFIAITDPGSKMQQVAESDGFRRIFFGVPSIGGRYSALSAFGMVPAAMMGIDVQRFLQLVHSWVSGATGTRQGDTDRLSGYLWAWGLA